MKEEKKKNHLPTYGVGPIYVCFIICLTIAGAVLSKWNYIPVMDFQKWRVPGFAFGIFLNIGGVCLWIRAVLIDRIDSAIKENRLITTGVYAWVRNPIYSAFLLICTGVVFMMGNVYLFSLIILDWMVLTILMKCTEEKWLKNLYGEEYEAYCKKVNRCWPWIPKE